MGKGRSESLNIPGKHERGKEEIGSRVSSGRMEGLRITRELGKEQTQFLQSPPKSCCAGHGVRGQTVSEGKPAPQSHLPPDSLGMHAFIRVSPAWGREEF